MAGQLNAVYTQHSSGTRRLHADFNRTRRNTVRSLTYPGFADPVAKMYDLPS